MRFRELQPIPEVADWIERFWLLEVAADELGSVERCAPDGAVEIMVHLGTPLVESRAGKLPVEHPRSAIVGHVVDRVLLEPKGPIRVAAARLRPSAVGPIFRAPAYELVGETVDAGELLGEPGRTLFDRVASAGDPLLELASAVREVASGARPSELTRRAERQIVEASGRIRIRDLASELGATDRSLQRRFRDQVGMSPKRFATLRRFGNTCRMLRQGPMNPLVEIALRAGYTDQPHFNREFRALTGVAPRRWLGKDRRLHRFLNLNELRVARRS